MAGMFSEVKEEFIETPSGKIKRIYWLDEQGNVLKTSDIKIPNFSLEINEPQQKDSVSELISFLEKISWIPVVDENLQLVKSGEKEIVPAIIAIIKGLYYSIFKSSWNSRN